ncbi:hypothetical protein M758_2G218100 [Ceratodon purpureus]|nr:hypothetical protein M758_2G218100 [Ceratodon purpureus]
MDMAHGHHDENLEIRQNQMQGSFPIKKPGYFRVINLEYSARLVLLSCVIASLQIGTYCWSLMAERLALGDEIAESPLVFIFATLILLAAHDGMKGNLVKSARLLRRHAIPLLIASLGLTITGARAELRSDKADIQKGITTTPNASEVHENALLKAVAVFVLFVLTTIGVAVAGSWMVNLQVSPFRTTKTAAPAIQAIPALPIIPIVQGDDMDDVLARAPVATRLNSPLSWL